MVYLAVDENGIFVWKKDGKVADFGFVDCPNMTQTNLVFVFFVLFSDYLSVKDLVVRING